MDKEQEMENKFRTLSKFLLQASDGGIDLKYRWTKEKVDAKTEARRLKCLDSWIKLILETVFPEGNEEVYNTITSKLFSKQEKVDSLQDEIIKGYQNCTDRQLKRFLLMQLSLGIVQQIQQSFAIFILASHSSIVCVSVFLPTVKSGWFSPGLRNLLCTKI